MPDDEVPQHTTIPRSLTRSERIMAVAAALLAVSAVVVVIGLVYLSRVHAEVLEEVTLTRGARAASYSLLQASVDAETGQRGYLLTGDQRFLAPYEASRHSAREQLTSLHRVLETAGFFTDRLERVDTLTQRGFASLAELIDDYHRGGVGRSAMLTSLDESKAIMDAMRAETNALIHDLEQRVEGVRAEERRTTDFVYIFAGVLGGLTMSAVGIMMLALRSERRSWRAAFLALTQASLAAEEARAKAAASDLAKTRFLAVASHDMRQPLHALTLYLSALERRVEGAEARGIITKMTRATDSMVSMFATLLDLARIQAGVVNPEIERFPLQDVLDRIVAENPGGAVSARPTPIALKSDPVLIERALRNLVSNALRHGGGRAKITATIEGDSAQISVIDDGPGIPAEDQERIFDEFVRLDGKAGAEGLGLGLAIVKRICDMLGMPLQVVSSPDRGARFSFRAPLDGVMQQERAKKTEDNSLAGTDVLVVDDDALAREAVSGALQDLNAHVRAAANEMEALAILDSGFAPKLLVMDLRIDGALVGVDIARRIQARQASSPEVIVITGDTGPETLTLLRGSGFAWLIKPVSPSDLAKAAAAQVHAA